MNLYVFDFDGTLIRKGPPASMMPEGWYSSLQSLPYPQASSWFIPLTTNLARSLTTQPNHVVVLQTGRETWFEPTIRRLVEDQELWFDYIWCRPAFEETLNFKLTNLNWLLSYFIVEKVFIWDDQADLLSEYLRFCKQFVPTRGFLVNARRMIHAL